MSCIQIFIPNILQLIPSIPQHLLEDNGSYVLDLGVNFDMRFSKNIEQLTDLNRIKTDGVLGFSLPATPKNDLVLKRFVLPSAVGVGSSLRVLVLVGSRAVRQTDLYILGYQNNEYNIEIRNGQEHWLSDAKDLKLKDVDLGAAFNFTKANVLAQNALAEYTDNSIGIRFPVCNYGGFYKAKGIDIIDLRPHYSILWLLQKAFCKIGWAFKSPLLESDWGRRLICYIIDANFGQDEQSLSARKFSVIQDTVLPYYPSRNYVSINFNKVIFDNGNNYNSSSGHYKGACIHDVFVKVVFKFKGKSKSNFNNKIEDCDVETKLIYDDAQFGALTIESQTTTFNSDNYNDDTEYTLIHEFVARNVQQDPSAKIYVTLNWVGELVKLEVLPESVFYNEPKKTYLQQGDTFKFQDLINTKLSLLDLVKGVSHLVGAKMHTDFIHSEVWLLPTYNTKIYNDANIDGFFYDNILDEDVTQIMQVGSEQIKTEKNRTNRYKTIKFKGAGDASIQSLSLKENEYYLAHTIDFGAEFSEEFDVSENPLFEATVNLKIDGRSVNGEPLDLPCLFNSKDAEKPKVQYDIAPRVLYWHGNTEQFIERGANSFVTPTLNFMNDATTLVPYAYQYAGAQIVALQDEYPVNNVAFGLQGLGYPSAGILKYNLFKLFLQRFIYETESNSIVNLLLHIEKKDFWLYDFRKSYSFEVLGRTLFGRMVAVKDFAACDATSTPCDFVPTRQTLLSCEGVGSGPIANFCIGNNPTLLITKIGNCYNFALGGASVSPIQSATFEYKYFSSTTWISAASLCNPTGGFDVRMVVDYSDTCPTIYRRSSVDACGNAPTFAWAYNAAFNCFTVTTGGINTSPLAAIVIEYSVDSGTTWLNYTPICNTIPSGVAQILLRVRWEYADGCDDVTKTNTINLPIAPPTCVQVGVDATCDTTGFVARVGNVVGNVALDIIQYRSIGSIIWQTWNNVTPITPCPFEYRRVVFFCNSECPTYCTAIKICNCTACNATTTIASAVQPNGSYNLIANVLNCAGASFEWFADTGAGFVNLNLATQSINVTQSATYKVQVLCANGCTAQAIIILTINCVLPIGAPQNVATCN